MADKSKAKVIKKLSDVWKDIKNPSKQSEIDRNISLYNAMVMGMHNYYCMATMVSADFAEIAFKVTGKSNGMNHNNRCFPIERQGEINSKFIMEKYGKSKQFRWIKGRMIIPVGYVSYEYPKYRGVKSIICEEVFRYRKLYQFRCHEIYDGKCTSLSYTGDGRQRSFKIYSSERKMCGNTYGSVCFRHGVCTHQAMQGRAERHI